VHHRLADWLDRRRGFAAAGASPSRHSPPKRLNPTPRGGDWRGRGRGFSASPSSRTRATGQRKSASETHIFVGWAFKWARPISAAKWAFCIKKF
jgi:hypothetical protein